MLSDILSLNLFHFFLIFARVGSTIMMLPGFSAVYVSAKVRLSFALLLAFVLTPVVSHLLPAMPASVAFMFLIVLGEIVIGLFLGLIGRILVGALQTAGTLIALYSSLANALIQDPLVEQQSSTIASLLSLVGLLLIFTGDLHHLMLTAAVDSYSLFVPGQSIMAGDFAEVIVRKVADSFAIGLQLASPFIITALAYYIGLGLMGRLNPQLQVFFIGMPIQITVQIAMIGVVMSGMMLVFLRFFEDGYAAFVAP